MKLSVSNIAWGNKNFSSFLRLIKDQACDGVEIAPSLIWPEPIDSTKPERVLFQNQLKEFDLELMPKQRTNKIKQYFQTPNGFTFQPK